MSVIESQPLFELRGGESWRDPWSSYRRLQEAPVQSFDHPGFEPFWVLSRFADVFDAVRDTTTFSSAKGLTPDLSWASSSRWSPVGMTPPLGCSAVLPSY